MDAINRETLCTSKEKICAALDPHAAHCLTVSEGGMPCVRGLNHAGDVHAFGVPSGAPPAPARGQICGDCGEPWPGHTFECPQYRKHGTGAPPAPPRVRGAADDFAHAVATMEQIAHLIGIFAGMRSVDRLIDYLEEVSAGRGRSPIGLHLSPAEVLDFLRRLGPVLKAAIHLHDLAMTREGPTDGNADAS